MSASYKCVIYFKIFNKDNFGILKLGRWDLPPLPPLIKIKRNTKTLNYSLPSPLKISNQMDPKLSK